MINDIVHNEEVGTITIDGEKYLVNLIWSGSNEKSLHKEQMKLDAQQLGTDLVCKYKAGSGGYIFGLADRHLGHNKGDYALAAMLYITCNASFIGAWEVDNDLWVLIAANDDGFILIDKVCRGQDELTTLFYSNFHLYTWAKVFGPSFLHCDAEYVDIRELLTKRIKVVAIGSTKIKLLTLSILIGIGVIAIFIKNLFYSNDEKEKIYRPNPVVLKHQEFPGVESPLPIRMINECEDEIIRYTYELSNLPGWKISGNVHCDGKAIHIGFIRVFGSKEWLEYGLLQRNINNYHQIDETNAELDLPINYRLYNDNDNDISLGNVRSYLTSIFQNLELSINFMPVEVFGSNVDKDTNMKYDKKYFFMNFDFSAPFSLKKFIPVLEKVDGLVINNIEYTSAEQMWRLHAVVYSTRK